MIVGGLSPNSTLSVINGNIDAGCLLQCKWGQCRAPRSHRSDARVHQPGYSGGQREALLGGVVVAEVGDTVNARRKFDPLDNILRNIYSLSYQVIDTDGIKGTRIDICRM